MVFKDLQFELKQTGKYLITGESESGKSTLLKLLNGFLKDYEGSLTCYQQECKTLTTSSISEQILFLDQQPYLFSGSIQENLTLGESFSDVDLEAALKAAGFPPSSPISDFLAKEIGEHGSHLSGGQRQRLALARGLLRRQHIILLG